MVEIKKFLCATLLILSKLSVINAYNVTCSYNQVYPYCGEFFITPVNSSNEAANIVDQLSTYVDDFTQNMTFGSFSPINFIPTDLFNKLIGVKLFSANWAELTTITTNAFVNCNSLEKITLSQNPFTKLPASFAEQCKNVTFLEIYQNELVTIDEKAFNGMHGLQEVILVRNKITCLPPLLFQDNKGIQNIDLSGNYIGALHPLLFQNMTQLKNVDLTNNQISYIPDLDLHHTGIQDGTRLMLNGNPIIANYPLFLTHLYTASFNYNYGRFEITHSSTCIPENYSENNWQTDPYRISGNDWYQQNISYTFFTSCYSNWTPQMADNSMIFCGTTFTPKTTTTSTTTLRPSGGVGLNSTGNEVILSDSCTSYRVCRYYLDYLNRYTCVIDGADGSVSAIGGIHSSPFTDANVERVYFVNSQLSRIPNVLFQKFPNLNFLYVRSCGMGVINDHTFNACGNLKFLDASFNDIIHIDETSLRNCTKLETIDLTGNPLDYVSTQLYVYDPSLKKIHFNRNADFTLD